jgi:hypothetical protein
MNLGIKKVDGSGELEKCYGKIYIIYGMLSIQSAPYLI